MVWPSDWSRSLSPLAAHAEFAWASAPVSLVLLIVPGGPFTSPADAAAAEKPTNALVQTAVTTRRLSSMIPPEWLRIRRCGADRTTGTCPGQQLRLRPDGRRQ